MKTINGVGFGTQLMVSQLKVDMFGCAFHLQPAGNRRDTNEMMADASKRLWHNNAPSKVLIFAWRLLMNKFPTREALCRRGIVGLRSEIFAVFSVFNQWKRLHIYSVSAK